MIKPINHFSLENPASVYDEEAMTALELAGRTASKVNEAVDAFNRLESDTEQHLNDQDQDMDHKFTEQNRRLTKMEDEQIPQGLERVVNEHIQSGAFDEAISHYAGALTQRVDNLLSNVPEGSTTMDAEIVDGRVGADGRTYANIGQAIRAQYEDAKSRIDAVIAGEFTELRESDPRLKKVEGSYISSDGNPNTLTDYLYYTFVADKPFDIFFRKNNGMSHLTVFKTGQVGATNLVAHYSTSQPLENAPLHIPKGYMIAISTQEKYNKFSYLWNYGTTATRMSDSMQLSQAQFDGISEHFNLDGLYDTGRENLLTKNYDGFIKHAKTLPYNTGLAENSSYDTYALIAPRDMKIWVTSVPTTYLAFTLFYGGKMDTISYIDVWRESNPTLKLPKVDSPLEIKKGHTLCVTVPAGGSFSVHTDLAGLNSYLGENIILHENQVMQVKNALGTGGLRLVHTVRNGNNYMVILKPLSGGYYLGVKFQKTVLSTINSNVWRLDTVDIYENVNGEYVTTNHDQVVINGEWETALQEQGASDHMGGTAHGDENMSFFTASLDGQPLDFTQDFNVTGEVLEMVQASTLNRVDTPSFKVANLVRYYRITTEAITIEQGYKFLADLNMKPSYVTMLPINRKYTTKAWRTGDSTIEDVSTAGGTQVYTQGNKQSVRMFGPQLTASVDVECESEHTGELFISNAEAYSKVYFTFLPMAGDTVKANEKVKVKTTIKINVNMEGM
jgi:hypothetical protein